MIKIIFLDIDGVLNSNKSKQYMPAPYSPEVLYVGIDEDKLLNLKHIVDDTGAEIYLTSTWKYDWDKEDKSKQDEFADEIDRRFAAVGLEVTDKTYEDRPVLRGQGIHKVLEELNPDDWVILDDEVYPDFDDYYDEIFPHFVQTSWYGDGLNAEEAELAIQVLNGKRIVKNGYEVSTTHHGKK